MTAKTAAPQSILVRGLPLTVKSALEAAAVQNNRSLNKEIVHRLTQSVAG